jgi:hypothetical protein
MMSLSIFSLVACTSIPRPDANLCGINAKSQTLRCYNLKSDYTDDGTLKPDAKPFIISIKSIQDLNAGVYASPKDFQELKAWVGQLREYYKQNCKVIQ